jgi:hypothetical protein
MATLSVAGIVLATVLGLLASCSSSPTQPTPADTATTTSAAGHVSDQQLAGQLNAILGRYPNTEPVAVAQPPTFVAIACQPGNPYQSILPAAGWQQVHALLASSGRCGR